MHVKSFKDALDVPSKSTVHLDVRNDLAHALVDLGTSSIDVAQLVDVVRVLVEDLGVKAKVEEVGPVDLIRQITLRAGRAIRESRQGIWHDHLLGALAGRWRHQLPETNSGHIRLHRVPLVPCFRLIFGAQE